MNVSQTFENESFALLFIPPGMDLLGMTKLNNYRQLG